MDTNLKEVAKMIDHALLHPTMTDQELKDGCKLALEYKVAAVCVKPYFVKETAKLLEGSKVHVCAVIGFPHGNSTIKLKVLEARQGCKDGATEIDMVVNCGKVLGEDWSYVRKEIKAINKECVKHKAILKVIFENDFLPEDHFKIKLCKICSKIGVAFVKTSTGYGFVKGEDGRFSSQGATEHDLKLMRKHTDPKVQIKAAGGIRKLDSLLWARELGCTRIGASATVSILEEAKARLGIGQTLKEAKEDPSGY